MANEIRLRSNNMSGTISDNPLAQVSTTINSPGFVDLPVVDGTNHLILVLDPLEVNGAAEIVQVTAHTAAASSVTVTRGFEGSVPRAHILGTTWFHGPVVSDYNYTQRAALSTNRPPTPFNGELIYETDTDKYIGRSASGVWQDVVPLGAWQSYTPTDLNITLGNGSRVARFARIGRTVHFSWSLVWGNSTAFTGAASVGLPVAAASTGTRVVSVYILDSGTQNYTAGALIQANGTVASPVLGITTGTAITGGGSIAATVPFTWTTNDQLVVAGTYEAAS